MEYKQPDSPFCKVLGNIIIGAMWLVHVNVGLLILNHIILKNRFQKNWSCLVNAFIWSISIGNTAIFSNICEIFSLV